VVAFDLADVVMPADITVNCETAHLNSAATAPSQTGSPSINGAPIGQGGLCSASISFTDERFDICKGSYEILRTWKVRNTCHPVGAGNPADPHTGYPGERLRRPAVCVPGQHHSTLLIRFRAVPLPRCLM
jgi:hypothetical protein